MPDNTSFESRFDSCFAARQDLRLYNEAKGYRWGDGDRLFWEPQDPTDLEPEIESYPPGAMRAGELDDWDFEGIEEF